MEEVKPRASDVHSEEDKKKTAEMEIRLGNYEVDVEPCTSDVDTKGTAEMENRLGNCEVCRTNNSKYTCPRCELRTCSLDCIKIHKKELECGGNRDVTSYVPLRKFDNLTLLSDYRFLEDVTRTLDSCQRNPLKKSTRFNRSLPPHLSRLKSQAMKRNTQLQFLPQHFTRHKDNTSFLHFASGIIFWKLEVIFPKADNVKVVIDKCSENDRLSKILSQYIDFDKCPEMFRNHLRYYHSTGWAGLEILLKAENVNSASSFFLLDMSLSLKDNLEGRIIIENPVVFVIHKTHKEEYEVLDDDLKCNLTNQDLTKGTRIPGFSPYHYFDTVSYSKKEESIGDKAESLIRESVNELKKYFSFDEKDTDNEDCSEKEVTTVSSNKKVLHIPQYEDLIKS